MARTRARRDEPAPDPGQLVLRGILGDHGLDPADLRQAALTNHELYGFFGVSVWVTSPAYPRESIEQTKLVKFERYAEFIAADLTRRGLQLWATGQEPHYDVVHAAKDLQSLVGLLAAAPHQVRSNPHVEREER